MLKNNSKKTNQKEIVYIEKNNDVINNNTIINKIIEKYDT